MIDFATQIKITNLHHQIHTLYQAARKRDSGRVCDICGTGDITGKNGVAYKVRQPVKGYEGCASQSPRLCHRHATGWALSYLAFDPLNQQTRNAVNLHFASYLAKQLGKTAAIKAKEKAK